MATPLVLTIGDDDHLNCKQKHSEMLQLAFLQLHYVSLLLSPLIVGFPRLACLLIVGVEY